MKGESQRRAKFFGISTVMYWIENDIDGYDIDEMPKPHHKPNSYIKTSILWAFYYLKHKYQYEDAIRDIVKRCGDT